MVSGYGLALKALDADEQRYGGDPKWDTYIADQRRKIDLDMRLNGVSETAARAAKPWPTLSAYLSDTRKTCPLKRTKCF
jgi:hypothetical protein